MSSPSTHADVNDPVGAVWRRWEPHIHTPGTALNDCYTGSSMSDFLDKVEQASPVVECLAITDYCLTRRYKEVVQAKAAGRLPQVKLLFCNVELRFSIETKAGQGINVHLLVSPDDPDHLVEIERFLAQLSFRYGKDTFQCTESDLRRLGRCHDESIRDDEAALQAGVNQFKVDFNQLKDRYEDSAWMKSHVLVGVAGSSNDGTAGLQETGSGFAALRKAVEEFAHIIFTATPRNIAFWRGEGVLDESELTKQYGGPKPCLHGSDAHSLARVANPDSDRRCWIKGDPTFESLKQACLEPRGRVSIGSHPPEVETPFSVQSVATPELDWLVPSPLPINPGMVAIIGARGSGKTALADLIAHAGDSPFPAASPQSFVSRARPHLGSNAVVATWSGDAKSRRCFSTSPATLPEVHYLTQQFVDRLCSSEAESDELLDEIKRVVFLAHDPESRLGADSFDALVALKTSSTTLAVTALNQRLDQLSNSLLNERAWYSRREPLTRELAQTREELRKTELARQQLIKPGGQKRAEYYTRLGSEISQRQKRIQDLNLAVQSYRKLTAEVQRYSSEILPRIVTDMQQTFGQSLLSEQEWNQFAPKFAGDPIAIIALKIAEQLAAIKKAETSAGTAPTAHTTAENLAKCSLESLKKAHEEVGKLIGADQKNGQRLKQLNALMKTHDARRQKLETDLKRATESKTRIAEILKERASLYKRFFDLIIEHSAILEDLYRPLASLLAAASPSVRKLGLKVVRTVDVDAWAASGEALLDLRKNGKFRGRGALATVANEKLLQAWQSGTADEATKALEDFRAEYDQSLVDQSSVDRSVDAYAEWIIDLGRWLYSTEHIRVSYSIEYEGVPITQLSPGTRGIVLLLLYLALDLEDSRPLIIDQPEENLDPKSVFTELLELFSEARKRRQVIIVTHNANLVVNTDVDQVIVASCSKPTTGAPPRFTYLSGGLENPHIRAEVCEILEGGTAAFKQRARRLRLLLSD